jgi:hypothetical protein
VPSLAPTRPRAGAVAAVCAALAAVPVAAGCGESARGNADGDPASLVPRSAPLYGEAVVRPEGDQRVRLDALLRRILRTDNPGAKLEKVFDDATRKNGITYARDVKPWLGKRVGAFLAGLSGGHPQGAAIIATTDTPKALETLRKGETVRASKTYRDVAYQVLARGPALAGVGDFAVIGTEGAVRQVIDTSKDSGKSDYGDARGQAGTDGLATVYIDPDALLGVLESSGKIDPAIAAALHQAVAGAAGRAIAASVQPQDAGFDVTAAAIGLAKSSTAGGDAAGALASVPGDAWLAVGLGNIGGKLDDLIAQTGRSGALAGIGIDVLLGQFRQESGIDIRKDVLSWMGDGALFVRGSAKGRVGGALVVRSKDPGRSAALIPKLAAYLRKQNVQVTDLHGVTGVDQGIGVKLNGAPEILAAAAGNRFVVAVGRSSLQAALRPAGRLGANAAFRRAAGHLAGGIRPAFFFDIAPVLTLIDHSSKGNDPGFKKAEPYLRAFTVIVAGAKRDGDIGRLRAFVGVR